MLLLTFNRVLYDLPTENNIYAHVIFKPFKKKEKKSVRVIGSFEKSRVREMGGETTVWSISEANSMATWFGSRYREVRETEGSRNRDSTVLYFMSLNFLFRLSTRNGAIINENSQTFAC